MGSLSSKNLFIFKRAGPTAGRHTARYHFHRLRLTLSLLPSPRKGHERFRRPRRLGTRRTFKCLLPIFPRTKKRKEMQSVQLSRAETSGLDTVMLCPHSPSLRPSLFLPSWYSHMSNGITTASGEVSRRRGAAERERERLRGGRWRTRGLGEGGRGRGRDQREGWDV